MAYLVESLKRMYAKGDASKTKVADLVKLGRISRLDYLAITGEEYIPDDNDYKSAYETVTGEA